MQHSSSPLDQDQLCYSEIEGLTAISLHQPWASLIAEKIKTKETRNWAPPKALEQKRIAIHAAKTIANPRTLNRQTRQAIETIYGPDWPSKIPRGALLATARLDYALQVKHVQDRQATPMHPHQQPVQTDPYGDFSANRWIWILSDIQKLPTPIPETGHQRLWTIKKINMTCGSPSTGPHS